MLKDVYKRQALKLRIFLSVCIFAAFLGCMYTHTDLCDRLRAVTTQIRMGIHAALSLIHICSRNDGKNLKQSDHKCSLVGNIRKCFDLGSLVLFQFSIRIKACLLYTSRCV